MSWDKPGRPSRRREQEGQSPEDTACSGAAPTRIPLLSYPHFTAIKASGSLVMFASLEISHG